METRNNYTSNFPFDDQDTDLIPYGDPTDEDDLSSEMPVDGDGYNFYPDAGF